MKIWLKSWAIAYLVVIPVILIVAPKARRLVEANLNGAIATTKHKIAFALIMGIITICVISFTLISVNIGFGENFVGIWIRSWGMGYQVVIPALLFIAPRVQILVEKMFEAG